MNLFELNTILYLIYLIGNLNLRIVLNDLNEFDTDIRLILYVVFIVLSFSIFWGVLWLCYHYSFMMFIILNVLLVVRI
jgi:hypothetical protein